jgi:hypothetical protein
MNHTGNPHTLAAFDKPVELCRLTCGADKVRVHPGLEPGILLGRMSYNYSTTDLVSAKIAQCAKCNAGIMSYLSHLCDALSPSVYLPSPASTSKKL